MTEAVEDLKQSYSFLRMVEHRLQMIDDRQTHTLPADDAGLTRLSVFLGYGKLSDFVGLLVAPTILAIVFRVSTRRAWLACHLAVGSGFALINSVPWVAVDE